MSADYNDGRWHGWNGGECPVHPKAQIEAVWHEDKDNHTFTERGEAGLYDWQHGEQSELIRFRIVTPYVEPKPPLEHWSIYFGTTLGGSYYSEETAQSFAAHHETARVVHMREYQP